MWESFTTKRWILFFCNASLLADHNNNTKNYCNSKIVAMIWYYKYCKAKGKVIHFLTQPRGKNKGPPPTTNQLHMLNGQRSDIPSPQLISTKETTKDETQLGRDTPTLEKETQ